MIITTHNLALLFKEFNLKEKLAGILPILPKRVSLEKRERERGGSKKRKFDLFRHLNLY
jgi:hypothetical protein